MAEFQLKSEQQKSMGDYLVESIFESGWMPKTAKETRKTAAGIIDVITLKLQTWVRGYLWIIIIESIVYISTTIKRTCVCCEKHVFDFTSQKFALNLTKNNTLLLMNKRNNVKLSVHMDGLAVTENV